MTGINTASQNLLQSQLNGIQTRAAVDMKVAAKTLDMARDQGDMALKLLDQAAQVNQAVEGRPTYGALVSGLGQKIDISA